MAGTSQTGSPRRRTPAQCRDRRCGFELTLNRDSLTNLMLNRREFLGAGAGIAARALLSSGTALAEDDAVSPRVDCHTHFYDPTRPEGIPWPGKDDRVLYRTVLPRHFLEQAAPLGVT